MGVYLTGVHLMGVYLTGVHLTGVHLTGVHLTGAHLIGVYFMGVHLIGVYLTGVHLMGVYLTGVHLMGVYLTGRAPHSENELIPWSQGLRPSQQLLLDLLPHELQPPSKKTHTSSLHLLRQLDLRQMAGLDEKECKQSARRSRGGQGGSQWNRQESDDLNTKGIYTHFPSKKEE
jgi:hypothetical protein